MIASEALFQFAVACGHKPLLRDYECTIGVAHLITKKAGRLYFFTIGRSKLELELVATYYMKRYGIKDVPIEVVAL